MTVGKASPPLLTWKLLTWETTLVPGSALTIGKIAKIKINANQQVALVLSFAPILAD